MQKVHSEQKLYDAQRAQLMAEKVAKNCTHHNIPNLDAKKAASEVSAPWPSGKTSGTSQYHYTTSQLKGQIILPTHGITNQTMSGST